MPLAPPAFPLPASLRSSPRPFVAPLSPSIEAAGAPPEPSPELWHERIVRIGGPEFRLCENHGLAFGATLWDAGGPYGGIKHVNAWPPDKAYESLVRPPKGGEGGGRVRRAQRRMRKRGPSSSYGGYADPYVDGSTGRSSLSVHVSRATAALHHCRPDYTGSPSWIARL